MKRPKNMKEILIKDEFMVDTRNNLAEMVCDHRIEEQVVKTW